MKAGQWESSDVKRESRDVKGSQGDSLSITRQGVKWNQYEAKVLSVFLIRGMK